MTTNTNDAAAVQPGRTPEPLGPIVDWLVAAVLVFGGLAVTAIGAAVYGTADRAWITARVQDGTIQSADLTNAELIDVIYGFAWWGGIGLLTIGLVLFVAGVAFLAYRRRSRARHAELGITTPDTTTNAIIGGVVTALTSFVPFSPVLGGAVSGYLQGGDRTDGARAGLYAGLVAAAPIVVLFVFFAMAFSVVATELALGNLLLVGVAGLFIGLLVTVVYLAGLSALGGYLGVVLAERNADETSA